MVNSKSALSFAMILPALILIGCEGQNTFRRTTNPVKEYQGAIDRSQQWKPGMGKRPPVIDADNRAFYCKTGFSLRVTGVADKGHLHFREDAETAYEIQILAKEKGEFDVTAENGPRGLKFNRLPDPSKRQLVWKPTREDNHQESVKIVVTDRNGDTACDFAFAEVLNLDVDAGPGQPILTISGLPTAPLAFGDQKEFVITIVDPAATPDKAPVITSLIADSRMLQNAEAKIPNLSADGAVDCAPGAMSTPNDPTKWTFACKILSSGLKNVDTFLKHPQTVNVVFLVKAKSQVSGRVATDRSGQVPVKFPELPPPAAKPVEVKPVAPKAADAKPADGKLVDAKLGSPTGLAGGATPKLKKAAPKKSKNKPKARTSAKNDKTADKKTKPASPDKTENNQPSDTAGAV